MTENLIPYVDQSQLDTHSNDVYDALSSGSFTPRIQLMTSKSALVEEGKFKANNYALVSGQDHKDVGASVDVIVCSRRPKALEIGDDGTVTDVHDLNLVDGQATGEFKRIMDRADSEKDSGCMYGPEFLLWIPLENKFATFFCGGKTTRREAKRIQERMGKGMTLKSKFIKTKKFSWTSPDTFDCSNKLSPPEEELFKKTVNNFQNPPVKEQVEEAEEDR